MKEILVLSGKGGTGKSTIALNLLKKFSSKAIADMDVDAPDMKIILEPEVTSSRNFYSNGTASINYSLCNACGECMKLCRFDAVSYDAAENKIKINPDSCEGCGLCKLACVRKAVKIEKQTAGKTFISKVHQDDFTHARLNPGAENSGKLVEEVKTSLKTGVLKNKPEYVIEDGAPGIGCPVISSLTGVSFVIIVTEPSLSGMHDFKRLKKLLDHFKLKYGVVINKADINNNITLEIERFCNKNSVTLLEKINYSGCVVESLNGRKYAYDRCEEFKSKIDNIHKKTVEMTAN